MAVLLEHLLFWYSLIQVAFACYGPFLKSGVDYHNPCVSLTRARAEVYSSTSIHLGPRDLGISGSGSQDLGSWTPYLVEVYVMNTGPKTWTTMQANTHSITLL